MKPLISVIIPAYNQAAFLPEAITSVLSQSYTNLEIILMDDGSIDTTPEIAKSFMIKDSRLYYFRQENQGPSAARNHAISYSQGEYICLLDADDRMEEKKIELQLSTFLLDPQIDIVYTALYIIDREGNRIGEMRSQDYLPNDFLAYMFFRNIIPNPNTIMAKRICFTKNPYNEQLKHAEDYELMLRLAHQYQFKYLDLALTSYRRHSFNLSNNLQAHRETELKVLHNYGKKHIEQVVNQSSLSNKEKYLLIGKILFNMEFFSDALSFFKELNSALAYFYSGNCYLKMNLLQQALHNYHSSLALDNTNAACYNNLGVVYFLLKEFDQARQHFNQALSLKNNYGDARYNIEHFHPHFSPKITIRELRQHLLPYSS